MDEKGVIRNKVWKNNGIISRLFVYNGEKMRVKVL